MTIHIGPKALVIAGVVVGLGLLGVLAGLIPFAQLFWIGLVLICPILMFFMMRDMHGGRDEHA